MPDKPSPRPTSAGARRNPLDQVPAEPLEALPEVLARRPDKKPTRNRSWDRKRTKATFDLPQDLIDRLGSIAEDLAKEYPGAKVRVSDVACLLLKAGLKEYDAGHVEVELQPTGFRVIS
jgi:hypothetical protein